MYRKLKDIHIELGQMAKTLNGVVHGDPRAIITGVCPLEEAKEGYLSIFTGSSSRSLLESLKERKTAGIIVSEAVPLAQLKGYNLVVVKNPSLALITVINSCFEKCHLTPSISSKAEISSTAKIGEGVYIGAFVSIGEGVEIGDGTVIYPHVVIYPGAKIGAGVTLHAGAIVRENCEVGQFAVIQNGAIIGADGFGYVPEGNMLKPVPQVGKVVLSERVDIGANTCIDRATLGETLVAAGAKIDNLVQIGHNTTIGQSTIVCGQAGISGSTTIGNGVVLGGGVGVRDHVTIADGCRFGARSGVTSNIPEKGDYTGYPAILASEWKRQVRALAMLPKIIKKLGKLDPSE